MDSVSQVKQRITIVDIVSSYLDLKKSGKNYKALCPFHSEDTPSFMVSPELGIYKCFGCGASGDIFSFVQEIEGISFADALKKLAVKAGVTLENEPQDYLSKEKSRIFELNELVTRFYSKLLFHPKAGVKGLAYLTETRGFSKETIRIFKLGYAPHTWEMLHKFLVKKGISEDLQEKADLIKKRTERAGYYDKFRGRVMFPLIDTAGKVVGFMGRTIFDESPKYLNTAGTLVFSKSDFIYGLVQNKIGIKQKGAILVEGPTDVISAYQAGINNVVAPLGTALTSDHLKILSRYTKEITLCFDSDIAGMEAIKRAVFLTESHDFNVKIALIPSPYKDLDEMLKKDPFLGKSLFDSPVSVYDFFLAYAFKKYEKGTGLGKKKIIGELRSLFSSVSNQVILDHYSRKIAQELELSESVVFSALVGEVSSQELDSLNLGDAHGDKNNLKTLTPYQDLETYFLALILKLDKISQILAFLEKIDIQKLFLQTKVQETLKELKIFAIDQSREKNREKFDIKVFVDRIGKSLAELAQNLFLWELAFGGDEEKYLVSEIETVLSRLEKKQAKREIDALKKDLELAELSGDLVKIREISSKIKEYSKKIL